MAVRRGARIILGLAGVAATAVGSWFGIFGEALDFRCTQPAAAPLGAMTVSCVPVGRGDLTGSAVWSVTADSARPQSFVVIAGDTLHAEAVPGRSQDSTQRPLWVLSLHRSDKGKRAGHFKWLAGDSLQLLVLPPARLIRADPSRFLFYPDNKEPESPETRRRRWLLFGASVVGTLVILLSAVLPGEPTPAAPLPTFDPRTDPLAALRHYLTADIQGGETEADTETLRNQIFAAFYEGDVRWEEIARPLVAEAIRKNDWRRVSDLNRAPVIFLAKLRELRRLVCARAGTSL